VKIRSSASDFHVLADAPTITRSMRTACGELHLDHLYVVLPGGPTYALDEKITATSLGTLTTSLLASPAD
jgi:hypothetical protein